MLRPRLPLLSAIYGLRWEHIEVMPQAELDEYVDQLPEVVALIRPRFANG
jgi:hypothetical protein